PRRSTTGARPERGAGSRRAPPSAREDRGHALSSLRVGEAAGPGGGVVAHVHRLVGRGDGARDGGGGHGELEEELPPARRVERRGPAGEREAPDLREEVALRERPVDQDRDAPVARQREEHLLRLALDDRVVELDEVQLFTAEGLLERSER